MPNNDNLYSSLQPHQIGMTWQYTIEWHGNAASDSLNFSNGLRKSIVVVTSKPRSQLEDTLITVKSWTKNVTKGMFKEHQFVFLLW